MGLNDWRPFIYGGLASCVAEFGKLIFSSDLLDNVLCISIILGTFPVDTSKTRLQIQGQKSDAKHAKLKYRGMIDCIFKIIRYEGLNALYAG